MPSTDIDRLVIYRRSDDTALLPMSSPTTIIAAEVGSNTMVTSSFGFTFNFDGAAYTQAGVSVNGYARLAGTVTTSVNSNLFAASTDVVLAPWWDWQKTAFTDGYVRTETQGTAPFRRWVCEWSTVWNNHTSTDYDRMTYQLVVYETRDKFEYRYGPRVRLGSPVSMSASTGFKGDTATVSTNYRGGEKDELSLGGYTTSPSTTLTAADYDAMTTIGVEPNWPMCGRYIEVPTSDVTGLQDPYANPAWAIANNVNWLYCNHRPPACAVAPYYPELTDESVYIVPVSGQPDHYAGTDVMITVWTSASTDVTVTIEPNVTADPSPVDAGAWDTGLYSRTETVNGWATWSVDQMFGWDDDVTQTHLRVTVSATGGTSVKLGSLVLAPTALDEVPTGERASGFIAMGLGQILQSGGAIHPEWYNRAWSSVAAVLSARPQMVWSSVWPYITPATANKWELLSGAGINQFRVIGIAPATLAGFRGQTLNIRSVAEAGGASPAGTITVSEEGGTGIALGVTASLTFDEGDLEVRSDVPVIQAVLAGAVIDVRPLGLTAIWTPVISSTALIPGVTPQPRLEYLVALVSRIRQAARTYALTGYATFLSRARTGTTDYVRLQWMIPPATAAMQARIMRNNGKTSKVTTALETSILATSSGVSGSDEIIVAPPFAEGGDEYVPEGIIGLALGSLVFNATPAAGMNRLLESPTATSWAGPEREVVSIFRGVGAGLLPIYPPADSV